MEKHSLFQYGLSLEMIQALDDLGYTDLTEVQKSVLPAVQTGQDAIVSSQQAAAKPPLLRFPSVKRSL